MRAKLINFLTHNLASRPTLSHHNPAFAPTSREPEKGCLEHRSSGRRDSGVSSGGAVAAVEHREELDVLAVLPHVRALGLRSRERFGKSGWGGWRRFQQFVSERMHEKGWYTVLRACYE